jgi:hypothetical protein
MRRIGSLARTPLVPRIEAAPAGQCPADGGTGG